MMHKSLKISHAFSSQDDFVKAYRGIYEHSAWVAEAAWQHRAANKDDDALVLFELMMSIVNKSTKEKKLKLLNLHPELADKTAIGTSLTKESQSEQTGAGLTECSPEEFSRFAELNAAYNTKFGFPFIIAVAGLGKEDILTAFETRIKNDIETEFNEALIQVHKIAYHRMKEFTHHD